VIKDPPIAAISSGLAAFLTPALQDLDTAAVARVHDLRSAPEGPAVTVFLYTVTEDPAREIHLNVNEASPILRYLITSWEPDAVQSQRLLSRALSRLRELATITLEVEGGEAMRFQVNLHTLSLEEQAQLWEALRLPFRVSLACEVRPAR
jgi:hypothetical protein